MRVEQDVQNAPPLETGAWHSIQMQLLIAARLSSMKSSRQKMPGAAMLRKRSILRLIVTPPSALVARTAVQVP